MTFGYLYKLIRSIKDWNKVSNLTCINAIRMDYLINLCKFHKAGDGWIIEAYVENNNTGEQIFMEDYPEGTPEYRSLCEIYDSVFQRANHIWGDVELVTKVKA